MIALLRGVLALVGLLAIACGTIGPAAAQAPSPRIALVIGNGAYPAGANATAANDAGLVAQTLTAAGFDVVGARDLDSDGVRGAFRDFLTKAAQLGPEGIAFVYLAGDAVQFEGDNYFVPVDATLARDSDVPIQAIRVSDLTRALSGVPVLARVIVIDGAYKTPFAAAASLAGGLALVEPEPGTLMAFNAAPGTLGPTSAGPYGVYGQAVAEMLRQGGIPVQEVFDRIRLRVNDATKGADVPWNASRLTQSFVFLERSPDAPAPSGDQATYATLERRPIREFPVAEAYNAAVARDTFEGYQDFVGAFPTSPYAARVRALLAARREALTWRKTVSVGSGDAYWSYLRRYPKGPHTADARRRLRALSVAFEPPPDFTPIVYDVPPPPDDEMRYVDEPVIVFVDPGYGPPPPPPPVYFLPPPEASFYRLPPPPPPQAQGFLPIPIPIPILYARPFHGPGRMQPPNGFQGRYPQPVGGNPGGGLAASPPGAGNGPPVPPAGPVGPGGPGRHGPIPPGQPGGAPVLPVPTGALPVGPAGPGRRGGLLPGQPGSPARLPVSVGTQPAGASGQGPATPGRPGSALPVQPAGLQAFPVPAERPRRGAQGTPAGNGVRPTLPGSPGAPVLPRAVPGVSANPGALPGSRPAGPIPDAGAPGAPPRPGQGGRPVRAQPQPGSAAEPPPRTPRPGAPQLRAPAGSTGQPQPGRMQQDQIRQQQLQLRQQQEQNRAQQLQQRQQQEQARQQQLQQQRQQQDQARPQQMQQQRQQKEQARQQQMQQQRQQQDQARQQQMQQQRQQQEQARQQMQQQRQQQQQQIQHQRAAPPAARGRLPCGTPGMPACR